MSPNDIAQNSKTTISSLLNAASNEVVPEEEPSTAQEVPEEVAAVDETLTDIFEEAPVDENEAVEELEDINGKLKSIECFGGIYAELQRLRCIV